VRVLVIDEIVDYLDVVVDLVGGVLSGEGGLNFQFHRVGLECNLCGLHLAVVLVVAESTLLRRHVLQSVFRTALVLPIALRGARALQLVVLEQHLFAPIVLFVLFQIWLGVASEKHATLGAGQLNFPEKLLPYLRRFGMCAERGLSTRMNMLFLWFILNSERLILAREQLRLRMWAAPLLTTLSFSMLGHLLLLAGFSLL